MTSAFYQISSTPESLIESLVYHLFTTSGIEFRAELLDVIIHSNPQINGDELPDFFYENQTADDHLVKIYMTFGAELCNYVSKDRLYDFKKQGMATYIKDLYDPATDTPEEENIPYIHQDAPGDRVS